MNKKLISNLNIGTGNDCAGHSKLNVEDCETTVTPMSALTFGATLPIGSAEKQI